MTKRDVLSIALRILGIIALYDVLRDLPGALFLIPLSRQMGTQQGSTSMTGLYIAGVVYSFLLLAVALVLILRADLISQRLIPEDTETSAAPSALSEGWLFTLAARIIGLFMAASGIPQLLAVIANADRYTRFGESMIDYLQREQGLRALTTVVFGIILLAAARYISDLIYGRQATEQTQD